MPENTLTRADIVDRLVQKVGLTKQDSSNFLERVLELVDRHQHARYPVFEDDLDHILGRGRGYLTYARYLDDMVVLTFDSRRGRRWADRALERIREEAGAIGVLLNAEKTRTVILTAPHPRVGCPNARSRCRFLWPCRPR